MKKVERIVHAYRWTDITVENSLGLSATCRGGREGGRERGMG